MSSFEITIQRRAEDGWPVVVRHQPPATGLLDWGWGRLELDLKALIPLRPSEREYGLLLGKALFREDIRDVFVRAVGKAEGADEPLRVLLIVEAGDLCSLHWEQLHAPLNGVWGCLLLNQRTPFSLYTPSRISRHFPLIGRRDLRALLLVAGPEELEGDYSSLAQFEVDATVSSVQEALGEIPCDVLATVEDAVGPPRLDTLCEQLTAGRHTLFHIVCHGAYRKDIGDNVLYFPRGEDRRPVRATELIECLGQLNRLPRFAFLSTCESANPQVEADLDGLGQRLVRELGMPAVVAMTDRISIATAKALASAFYTRLHEHGEVDRALCEARAGLQGHGDVTVPALFSRLGDQALWIPTPDTAPVDDQIRHGLERLPQFFEQRAPSLLTEFQGHSAKILASLGTEASVLSEETRRERDAALAGVNQLCNEVLDLSFDAVARGDDPPEYVARCPFPGLSAFGARFLATSEAEQDDRDFFFGREPLIERLRKKLAGHNFLPILGPSGTGKTSLVVAGLIPALQKGEPDLQMVYLTPGSHPLTQLEASRSEMNAKPTIVVVDQFEELFTLCADKEERQAFLDQLLALSGEMRVVIAMRDSFMRDCASYPALTAEMQTHQQPIGPMDAVELRLAMEKQAAAVGLRFEADLANTVLNEVQGEPGAMPLLQHALRALWERRHGRWLMAKEYWETIGGVKQAIAHTADALYEALSPDDREWMRDIFVRLTHLGQETMQDAEGWDTRRRVRLEDLVPAGTDLSLIRDLVQRLADARLVVTGPWSTPVEGQTLDDSPVKVEVAHEALIRYWPRLRGWLDEDRPSLRLRAGIGEAAQEWREHKEAGGYLVHRDERLDAAEKLAGDSKFPLSQLEQEYVDACTALRDRKEAEEKARRQRQLEVARKLAEEAEARRLAEKKRAEEAEARQLAEKKRAEEAEARQLAEKERAEEAEARRLAEKKRAEEQEAAVARMRQLAVVIGAVAVVALVAFVFAVLQLRVADRERATAEEQRGAATSALATAVLDRGTATSAVATADLGRGTATSAVATAVLDRGTATSAVATAILDRATAVSAEATAVAEGARAEEQARISHIRELAALALSLLDRHLDLALLLSIETFQEEKLLQTRQALFEAWRHNPHLLHYVQGHDDRVWSVAWSEDGRLASGSADGTVVVWDLSQPDARRRQPAQTLDGHDAQVMSVAWSADDKLASGSGDGTVIVWDLERNRPGQILKEHSSRVMSVAWSADGRLASGSDDGTVIIWDLESGLPAQILEGHLGPVNSVAWSMDGRLASASSDETIIIWDLEGAQPGHILEGHSSEVRSVAWSVDGRLASSSEDQSVIIWDLESELPGQILGGHSGPVNSVAWSADGRLASGSEDRTAVVWDLEREVPIRILEGHAAQVWSVAWSADGRLATGSEDDTVIIWNLTVDVLAKVLRGQSAWVWSMAWSPDGQLASGLYDGTIVMWDLTFGEPAQILEGHSGPVNSVTWSKDGRLASGSDDHIVVVWDLEHGLPAQTLEGHTDWVRSVAWSVDGQLASGSSDHTVIVWDLEHGLPTQTLEGHSDWVRSVAWSAEGQLASGSDDGTVIVWDLERSLPGQILEGHSGAVNSVAWSMDGRLASASSDETIIIWDLEDGQPAQILEEHSSWVKSVAWSVDGRLASGSEDRTVIVWDLEGQQPAHTLQGHGAVYETVAWSANGQWLAVGAEDGTARVWPMEPQVWIDQACERAGRNLSRTEWAAYFPDEEYRKTCEQWPAGD